MASTTITPMITWATEPAQTARSSRRSCFCFCAVWAILVSSAVVSAESCSSVGGITRFEAIFERGPHTSRILRCRSTYNCRVGLLSDDHASDEQAQRGPARRILEIDYGSRRMGLAVSDALGITAQGLETLERKNRRSDFARLERVIRENHVQEIVLGYPLRMSGQEGTQSQKVAEFAEELRKKFELPVHLWDERLTSAEANRLLREADLSIQKRAQAVDRMAAVLILQSFLQARSMQ